jgi:hypothetical protein
VSLPVSSSITNETQLLASIPHALYVEKLIESEDHFWRWSGSGSCEVWDAIKGGALVRTDKEPTATTCFNVNAGEGFAVVVDQAAEYTILGTDGSTVLSLDAIGSNSLSGFNLVSLPFCTNVSTAGQLMNSIGFANTAAVERYICATDTFQVYTGRKASSPDFVLSPGEGYLVKMNTTTNYSTQKTSCALPLCTSGVATYSVSGSADTATFAFKIDNGLGETTCFNNCVAFTTAGESSVAIADDFANAINSACGATATATHSANTSTFSIVFNQVSPHHLWVGSGAGDPSGCANACSIANCDVFASGSAGCTFNPTITMLSGTSTTTPLLGTWGLIGLGMLIVAMGAFMLRRSMV